MKGHFCTNKKNITLLIYSILTVLIVLSMNEPILAQRKNLREIRREAEARYLSGSSRNTSRHSGNFRVSEGERIAENIVVTNGNATVNGMVRGTVITIDGDIILGSRGEIRGDAVAVSGDIIRRSGSVITGDEIQTSWRSLVQRDRRGNTRRWERFSGSDLKFDWEEDLFDHDVLFRYNRVEGLFLGLKLDQNEWDTFDTFNVYGDAGYGFKSDEWRYTLGIERSFSYYNSFVLGAKIYDLTDSDDYWRIGELENSLGAIFLKEDFIDHYNRNGFTFYIKQRIERYLTFNLEYRIDDYESMRNRTNWSFFGGGKRFSPNPFINEGEMESFVASVTFDTKDSYSYLNENWLVNLQGEYASPDLGGVFDFQRYIVELRRFQPLSRFENLNFRAIAGSSKNNLPIQRGFYLGGLSTLRAFDFKEFAGTSMLLGNVEYLFDPSRIISGPPTWILEDFMLSLFFDIGAVSNGTIDNFFDSFDSDDFKHNVGFGLLTRDEDFRVNFAWRTDEKGDDIKVTLRLKHAF